MSLKRILSRNTCFLIATLLISISASCDHHPEKKGKGGESNSKTGNSEASTANTNSAPNPEPAGDGDTSDDDVVIILRAQNDVFLKAKGSDSWVRVVKDWPFYSGDLLRIGDASKALVDCTNPCELSTGEYTKCCINTCTATNLHPPDGKPQQFLMKKIDLPPDQARIFADQESAIGRLGLDVTATQFLRAKLYTAWKLNEADGEIDALGQQLDKPETKEQLGKAYAAVMLKTAELFVKVDQKDKAAQRFQKTIDLPHAGESSSSAAETAAAHRRLAEIYVEKGKKQEAAEHLDRAKEFYVRQGDEKKVQSINKKMLTMRQP